MTRGGACAVAACVLFGGLLSSDRAGAQVRRFSSEETVLAVEIPVQVTRDGRPVEGLTRDDFEVRDGGGVREIVDFDVVDLAVGTGEGPPPGPLVPPVPSAGRRYFLFLFDLSNSDPAALARARAAVRRLALESLHPTDLAAVATWSHTRGPQIVVGFTTDRGQVAAAIETLGLIEPWRRRSDPLGLLLADIERSAPETVPAPAGESVRGGFATSEGPLVESLTALAARERSASRSAQQGEIAAFTQGFTALAELMANVVGRKYVVLLSQGFDSTALLGAGDPELDRRVADAAASGEIWDISSEERFGDMSLGNRLERMLGAFRRADCTIEAVDIGGLAVASASAATRRPPGRETLLTMAPDTGGQLFENFNDLSEAMQRMLRATSVTYVLTIQPRDLTLDGRFHELRVRLKGAAEGARALHRPGYFAPLPYEERPPADQRIETAQLLLTGEPGGELDGGVVAPAFRGEAGRAHVPVIVEMPGPTVLSTRLGARLPVSAYAYAFDPSGAVIDFVAQSFELDLDQVATRLAGEPLKFAGDLLLPPGSYLVRALVRAGDRGAYWIGQLAVEVPAFAPGELALVAPLVPEAMTRGLVVRNAASGEKTKSLPFPFVLGGDYFLPSALPALAASEPLRLALNVYGLAPGPVELAGELAAPGTAGETVGVEVVKRTAVEAGGLERFELRVARGGAVAGGRVLRIRLRQGGREATAATPVRLP